MTSNVRGVDRGVRLVLGIVLLALGFVHVVTGGLAVAAYVSGGIVLITGVFRYCPAWSVLGIITRQPRPAQKP